MDESSNLYSLNRRTVDAALVYTDNTQDALQRFPAVKKFDMHIKIPLKSTIFYLNIAVL